jgi:hypothetical protein
MLEEGTDATNYLIVCWLCEVFLLGEEQGVKKYARGWKLGAT